MDFKDNEPEVSLSMPYSYKNIVDDEDIFVRAAAEETVNLTEPEETVNLTESEEVAGSGEKKKRKKKQAILTNDNDVEFLSSMDISPKTKESLRNFLVSFKSK